MGSFLKAPNRGILPPWPPVWVGRILTFTWTLLHLRPWQTCQQSPACLPAKASYLACPVKPCNFSASPKHCPTPELLPHGPHRGPIDHLRPCFLQPLGLPCGPLRQCLPWAPAMSEAWGGGELRKSGLNEERFKENLVGQRVSGEEEGKKSMEKSLTYQDVTPSLLYFCQKRTMSQIMRKTDRQIRIN